MGLMNLKDSKDSKLVIYSDINSFLAKRGLDNKDDIAYIWRIKYEMFNEIRGWDLKDAKPYALVLKKVTKVNPLKSYMMNLLSLKNFVKYLYVLLPSTIACYYYFMINKLINVRFKA